MDLCLLRRHLHTQPTDADWKQEFPDFALAYYELRQSRIEDS